MGTLYVIIALKIQQSIKFSTIKMLKFSQWLGAAPPDPCSGNPILFWKPPSKNPGYAPAL